MRVHSGRKHVRATQTWRTRKQISQRCNGRKKRYDAPDVEQAEQAKNVEAPLVRGGDESANQTVDDQEPRKEESSENRGSGQGGKCQQGEEKQGCIDEPLNVSHILEEDMRIRLDLSMKAYPDLTGRM